MSTLNNESYFSSSKIREYIILFFSYYLFVIFLKALDEFKNLYPNIVKHLKELNKKAIIINKMSEMSDPSTATMINAPGVTEQDTLDTGIIL